MNSSAPQPTWTLTLPVHSQLVTLNARIHWTERSILVREQRQAAQAILSGLKLSHGIPDAAERRKLRIMLVRSSGKPYRQQRLDRDNAYGAMKPYVDSMVSVGLLVGDEDEWVDYRLLQRVEAHVDPYAIIKLSLDPEEDIF